MYAASILGLFSLLITIAVPVLLVFLLIWIYKIKKNSETQIEQNKEIIQLLRKDRSC
jgi:4-hydroxybenzoate polyprenyltransferase